MDSHPRLPLEIECGGVEMTEEIILWHDIQEDGLPNADEKYDDETAFLVVVRHVWNAFGKTMLDETFTTEAYVLNDKFVDYECRDIERERNGHTFEIVQWANMPQGVRK